MTATPPSGWNLAGAGVPSIFTIFSTPGIFEGFGIVERDDLAAEHRRPCDHGVYHALHPVSIAVLGLARP